MTNHPRLKVGDLGIDYSGARPKDDVTFKNDGRFVCRYSAGVGNGDPNAQWKLCGTTEIEDALAADMDFIALSEWYEGRITEGAAAGAADGRADLHFWQSRGLAKGASIYVAWDANPTGLRARRRALAYLKAYEAALEGYYHADCYAGTPFLRIALRKGRIRYGCRPNAGSWSNDGLPYQPSRETMADLVEGDAQKATPAALWQTGNYWYGKSADENIVLRTPVGSHCDALRAAAAPVDPEPKPSSHTVRDRIARKQALDAVRAILTGDDHGEFTHTRYPDTVQGHGRGLHDRLVAVERGLAQLQAADAPSADTEVQSHDA